MTMKSKDVERTLRDWYRYMGKRGGSVRSEKKREATRANIAKARAVLAEKRLRGEA